MKNVLLLRATKDICGNEVDLVKNHCELLGMTVYPEEIESEKALSKMIEKYSKLKIEFKYLYLCTHGNTDGFLANMGSTEENIRWSKFSQLICENEILTDETILLLACCKGGFFRWLQIF